MLTTVMHYTRHDKAGSDFTIQMCLLIVLGSGTKNHDLNIYFMVSIQ